MSDTVTVKPISRKEKPKKTAFGKKAVIAVTACAAALVLCATAAGAWALNYDKIYPNVTVYGQNVGGLTLEEAQTTLAGTMEHVFDGKALEVSLGDVRTEIRTDEVGASLRADTAALAAWNTGREGNVFARLGFAVSSLFSAHEVSGDNEFYIDRPAVERAVSALAHSVVRQPTEGSWDILEKQISVKPGQPGYSTDESAIVDAIIDKISRFDFTPADFQLEEILPKPVPLDLIYNEIYVEPQDAWFDTDEEKGAKLVPEVIGVSFDMDFAGKLIESGAPEVTIPLIFTTPGLTRDMLSDKLFVDVLSEYSTNCSTSTQNRVDNIALSTKALNGVILLPGEELSFNNVVGKRTQDRGYKMAGAYINGKLTDSLGGGICQTSSTLYNAVLLANLKVMQRSNHSMTVSYVPFGQDATVSWGTLDFVFSNNTGYPIQILGSVKGRDVTFKIMGTKTDDTTVVMEGETISKTPRETVMTVNQELPPGKTVVVEAGHDGYVVQTYRVLLDKDGKVVSREKEAKSSYRKSNKLVEIGPDTATTGGSTTPTPSVPPVTPSVPPTGTPTPVTPSAPETTPTPEATPSDTPEPTPSETPEETSENTENSEI